MSMYPPNSRMHNGICYDTALADNQWAKLTNFLSGKLSPEDMKVVEQIVREAGDAPESAADRRRAKGAMDAARRGAAQPVAYDDASFKHRNRLKV